MPPTPIPTLTRLANHIRPAISVCFSYCNRAPHFARTLDSFLYWYGCSREFAQQIEFCVVDDTSTDAAALPDLLSASPFQVQCYRVDRSEKPVRNPGVLFNFAVEQARAPLILLTNPENLHLGPVITHALDNFLPGHYFVYGCRTLVGPVDSFARAFADLEPYVNRTEAPVEWYQHSTIRDLRLHFCSVIERELFLSLGGFEPVYDNGWGFEDTDFVRKLFRARVPQCVFDDPAVAHQGHPRPNDSYAWGVNERIYVERWR